MPETGILVTSCNRTKQTAEAMRRNWRLLERYSPVVLIADNTQENRRWVETFNDPRCGGMHGHIDPAHWCTDLGPLRDLEFPHEILRCDWLPKQAGDPVLIQKGIQRLTELGCNRVLKVTGPQELVGDPLGELARLDSCELLAHERKPGDELTSRVFACRADSPAIQAALGDELFVSPAAPGYCEQRLLSVVRWSLDNNVFEAAMTVRAAVARKYGYTPASGGDEHHPLSAGIEKEGGCKLADMGWRASYVYRWGTALQRISGTLGLGRRIAIRTQEWVDANQDTGDGKPLTPADLTPLWSELAKAVAAKFPKDEALIRAALKLPAAIPAAMRIPGMPAPVPVGKPGEAANPAARLGPPPTGLVALQCACGKQPGIMIRAGKQWYLMRVESVKNATTVYSDKIAFCRGCFRPLQQDEPSAVPYEFGHDSAFDKQVRLLR